MSRNDSNFTYNSQGMPTALHQTGAGAPFTRRAPVWVIPRSKRRRRGWLIALLVITLVTVIGLGSGAFFWATRQHPVAAPKNQVVGQAFFTNSGQVDLTSGLPSVNDKLQIYLQHIPPPDPGKSYYAWLLRDETQPSSTPITLGALAVTGGTVHLSYVDPRHTNLLAVVSRIGINEEDAAVPPISPSLDTSVWKYSAELPQTPDPKDKLYHFSMLDHLRSLLVQDPILAKAGRPGGLATWSLMSTGRVAEWAYSARDFWQAKDILSMHQHFIRILDYLDGDTYVQADVPTGTAVAASAPLGLLGSTTPDVQNPLAAGYLHLISSHVDAIAQAPAITPEKHHLAAGIIASINTMRSHLATVRQDAKQLLAMSDAQLLSQSTLTILNNMMAQAFYAYVGQFDPSTGELQASAVQIHYDIEHLATLDITPYHP